MKTNFRSRPHEISQSPAFACFKQAEEEQRRIKHRQHLIFGTLFLLSLACSAYVGEVDIPEFISGLPAFFNYFGDTLPELGLTTLPLDVAEWYRGWDKWIKGLWDTVLIGFLATLLGFAAAFVLSFPASRNLSPNGFLYFTSRRILEIARSVPELVYALIFVFSFGLGPFPGVLAVAVHTTGALGKLFSEVNENTELTAAEGVTATGGNWFQVIRYAVIPQVLPNFMSYTLLRFEINVRAASVVGFVGAGGIGQDLMFSIRQFLYTDVSAIVLMLVATVIAIDISCEKLRHSIL
ncbi:MAG: phosphonate ABC transporter, permease protein PhnE [Desulfovermiculus sp.]